MAIEIQPLTRVIGVIVTGDLGGWTFYTNRRGRLVFFPQAPPLTPPSPNQTIQRNRLRLFGQYWRQCNQQQRDAWTQAAKKANLNIGGTALATAYILKPGAWINTVSRQSGIQLPPQ